MSDLGNSLPCRDNVMERCEASVCHLYKLPMCMFMFDSGLGCTDVCRFCNCKNKRQEESNTLESEKANSTSAKLDDTALPSDFDEDDSESDSESDIE